MFEPREQASVHDKSPGRPRKERTRGNGEGSIYQRKKDRGWCCAITPDNGKQKVLYGKKREVVAAKLSTALGNMQKGLPVAYERQSVATFLRKWLEDSDKPTVRSRTYDSYRFYVEKHIIPEIGRGPLATLSPQTVQAFFNRKAQFRRKLGGHNMQAVETTPPAPRTVQYMRAILRRALNQAVKWDLAGHNVATLVYPPRSVRREVEPLTPDQARTLLDALKGERLEALYTVAIAMGLREGEALGLRWRGVDLDAGVLHIRQELVRVKCLDDTGKERTRLAFEEPKTERSRRALHPLDVFIRARERHNDRQAFEKKLAGSRWRDTGLVFTSTIGTPIDPSAAIHRFHAILGAANLPRKRFHDLRHTCASLPLARGVELRLFMDVLGHSQISLTSNLYTQVLPAAKQEIAGRLDAVFAGAL